MGTGDGDASISHKRRPADRSTAHVADRIGHIVRWLDKRQFRADDVQSTHADRKWRSRTASGSVHPRELAEYVEQNGCLPCGPSLGAVWELEKGLDSVRLSANLFYGGIKNNLKLGSVIDVGGSHAGNAYVFFRLHALASRLAGTPMQDASHRRN